MIQIRRAEKNDCPQLLELVKELAEFEKAPEQVTITLKDLEECGFGNNPIWWAFVAVDINKHKEPITETVIGFALYYIRFSTWKGRRLYLEDLLVTKDYRNKGVGKLLFDAIIEEAKNKNFSGIAWQVLEWNEPAIQFYKKYNAGLDAEWVNGAINF